MRTRRAPSPGQLALGLLDDGQAIRDALVDDLRARQRSARFIPEMGLHHGGARIDLAVVDDHLDGYEVKGPHDDLRRLDGQAHAYGQVFDRLTLVGTERHLRAAERAVPAWWGLTLVDTTTSTVEPIRAPQPNPRPDPSSVARLLWRSELIWVLHDRTGRAPSGANAALRARLVAEASPDEVRSIVRQCIRDREGWRAAG